MEKSAFKTAYFVLGLAASLISVFYGTEFLLAVILGVVFIVFTFNNFKLSYMLFLAFMAVIPHDYWNNMYMLLATVFYYGVYIIKYFIIQKKSIRFKNYGISVFVLATALVLGTVFSYVFPDSLRILLFFMASFLAMFIITGSCNTSEDIGKYIQFISFGVTITALYAIYQKFAGVEVVASLVDTSVNSGMPGRVYSTFGNPNNYAEYLIAFMPFMFAYAISRKKVLNKIIYLSMFLLAGLALVLTYSRASWVAFAICVMVYTIFVNFKVIPFIIVAGLCCFPLLPSSIVNRILTIGNMKDSSNSYRLYIWTGVLKMLKTHWQLGIGLGPDTFHKIYPTYSTQKAILAPHSHMQYMEMMVEGGIIGFISYIAFHFGMIKRSILRVWKSQDKKLKNFLIAGIASVAGLSFIGIAEYIFFYPRVMYYFFVMAGLIFAGIKVSKEQEV